MKRQLIVVGLAVFALMVLAFISTTAAAPGNRPLLQVGEVEPNNSPEDANPVSIPAQITGKITQTGSDVDTDYFSFTTQGGVRYEADLTILTVDGMRLQLRAFDANEGILDTSSTSNISIQFSWESPGSTNYIQIRKQDVPSVTLDTSYNLEINQKAATSTPSPTPTPTPQNNWDAYEPNDSLDNPSDVSIGATLANLNFWPYDTYTEEEASAADDLDVFRVWCKPGHTCRAKTAVTTGVDTIVKVYAGGATSPNEPTIAVNDDYGETLGSQVTWQSSGSGYYKIWIDNLDRSPRQSTGQTYNLTLTDLAATPTPTPGPTETPEPGATAIPGIDQFEPNYDFAHATTIGTGITYQANFIPWGGAEEDNDYYKTWIKPGLHFVCETLDLAPGVDTNVIVYDGNQNAIGGNDDVELGDYRSRFAYFSTYEGWLYILVGHGGRLPTRELESSDYKIRCEKAVPGQATATATPKSQPTAAPGTPTPSESPITTPTPSEGLTVRPLTTPTPVPVTTPAPRFIPITLLVYYDANDDRQPGAGEGITGISAQAYEVATNQLLAQGFTDERGNLEFTVASSGPVRVSVPFFGFSQLVAGEGASIYVRVPPQQLPRGAP
jgi:hypothetical protein